jgi:hypothetical protein
MVNALLEGKQTQTRRLIKPSPPTHYNLMEDCFDGTRAAWQHPSGEHKYFVAKNPHGLPGDLLWVRENFKPGSARAAGRLALQITDARAQRLPEISEADAMAEGIHMPFQQKYACPLRSPKHRDGKHRIGDKAHEMFRDLWNDINGPRSWTINPWVWGLTFEVHRCNVDAVLSPRAA